MKISPIEYGIALTGSAIVIAALIAKDLDRMYQKEAICQEYFENTRQAYLTANTIEMASSNRIESDQLMIVAEDLSSLCSDSEELKGLRIKGSLNCDSFRGAYRESGRAEIPGYIVCNMEDK